MKLSEIKSFEVVAESKMSELHQEFLEAICDEFKLDLDDPKDHDLALDIMKYFDGHESQATDDFLFDHFQSQMPYGTQKARDGDPANWIADEMQHIFKKYIR